MACGCGCEHEHNKISKEEFENAVNRFLSNLPPNIDIDVEYEKIMNKKSSLSAMQRKTLMAIVEYKKEHFPTE